MIDKEKVKCSSEYIRMKKYADVLQKRIEFMERVMRNSPEGSIKLGSSHGRPRYYKRTFSEGKEVLKYIPSSAFPIAQKLGDKKIAGDRLRILRANLKACEYFLAHHSGIEDDEYAEYLAEKEIPYSAKTFIFSADRAAAWIARSGDAGAASVKNVSITTQNGDAVRSKSEAIIADALYQHHILYKYEYPLRLKTGQVFHPDFTIYDPLHDETVIWEHFGMTDDFRYYDDMCRKLALYQENRYLPGQNLICTFESNRVPMSSSIAEKTIELMLCPPDE